MDYNYTIHTHVLVKNMSHGTFDYPQPIVLHCGNYVFVGCTYADELPKEAVQVGDGRCNSYDDTGNRIVSVPAEWCTYYTEEEADGIVECMHVDERLLAYAI